MRTFLCGLTFTLLFPQVATAQCAAIQQAINALPAAVER